MSQHLMLSLAFKIFLATAAGIVHADDCHDQLITDMGIVRPTRTDDPARIPNVLSEVFDHVIPADDGPRTWHLRDRLQRRTMRVIMTRENGVVHLTYASPARGQPGPAPDLFRFDFGDGRLTTANIGATTGVPFTRQNLTVDAAGRALVLVLWRHSRKTILGLQFDRGWRLRRLVRAVKVRRPGTNKYIDDRREALDLNAAALTER